MFGAIAIRCPYSTIQSDLKTTRTGTVLLINIGESALPSPFHWPFMLTELSTAEIISRSRLSYIHIVGIFRNRPKLSTVQKYCKNVKNNFILQQ